MSLPPILFSFFRLFYASKPAIKREDVLGHAWGAIARAYSYNSVFILFFAILFFLFLTDRRFLSGIPSPLPLHLLPVSFFFSSSRSFSSVRGSAIPFPPSFVIPPFCICVFVRSDFGFEISVAFSFFSRSSSLFGHPQIAGAPSIAPDVPRTASGNDGEGIRQGRAYN